MNAWHDQRDGQWLEDVPPGVRPSPTNGCFGRRISSSDYRPDHGLFRRLPDPVRRSAAWRRWSISIATGAAAHGEMGVVTAKRLSRLQKRAIVEDVERGFVADIQPQPWQTDTCIGNWHYDRALYERDGYKSGRAGYSAAGRRCLEERQSDAQHSGARRRDDRRQGRAGDRRDHCVDARSTARRSTDRGRGDVFGEGPTKPPTGVMAEGEAKPFIARGRAVHGEGRSAPCLLHAAARR